jgi:hypothetical protein
MKNVLRTRITSSKMLTKKQKHNIDVLTPVFTFMYLRIRSTKTLTKPVRHVVKVKYGTSSIKLGLKVKFQLFIVFAMHYHFSYFETFKNIMS